MSRRKGGRSTTGLPPIWMLPALGGKKPAIRPSVVVLPQPEGPSSVMNSPSRTSRSMPATARVAPYRFSSPARRSSDTLATAVDEVAEPAHALDDGDQRERQQQGK